MTADEIGWLDAYHARLPAALDRLLDKSEREWLDAAARPL
jgi:Xaa-Pro aminopeptidase